MLRIIADRPEGSILPKIPQIPHIEISFRYLKEDPIQRSRNRFTGKCRRRIQPLMLTESEPLFIEKECEERGHTYTLDTTGTRVAQATSCLGLASRRIILVVPDWPSRHERRFFPAFEERSKGSRDRPLRRRKWLAFPFGAGRAHFAGRATGPRSWWRTGRPPGLKSPLR